MLLLQNRGLCLSNSDPIRDVHNSFARQHLFELDIRVPEKVISLVFKRKLKVFFDRWEGVESRFWILSDRANCVRVFPEGL